MSGLTLTFTKYTKNNSRNGFPALKHYKKRYYTTMQIIRINNVKFPYIQDGGFRHLGFREMLNFAQVETKLIWLS